MLRGRSGQPARSTGRGDLSRKPSTPTGNKDAQDVLAAVYYIVAQASLPRTIGVRMELRGMLTNYTIAQTHVQSAVSGASISNIIASYGTDQYVR